uniref:Capsid protein n=1 Tax=Parvoviridae sp. TaxID=1940570 RepID=A0A7D3UK42_9VIRU|nr:MAG: capsid protein [Parvoviridae sp.]QKE54863.1 MAG: capsid protein [Parvoviridae sp.]
MANKFVATNTWMCYIANNPYIYPNDNVPTVGGGSFINTGWHIFPNMLWRHFLTPKQWASLIITSEAYHVDSITIDVFNMIPMTQQLAIQGNTVFTAFNNCIYALGYTDELYETNWENWYSTSTNDQNHNLLYKEGQVCAANATTKQRYELPIYQWHPPNTRARSAHSYENWDGAHDQISAVYPGGRGTNNNNQAQWITKDYDKPTGVVWDPMNRPKHLMELRPGKNNIKYHWESHPCDSERWFNLDQICWWHPYVPEGPYNPGHQRPGEFKITNECDPDMIASKYEQNPWINDYTTPNWADLPVCPMQWWWKEIQQSIAPLSHMTQNETYNDISARRINEFFAGTEYECYKYGPTQFFIKMIPLFDESGTHIKCTANVSVRTTLTLSTKKRRSALYAPTWGPFSWYDVYTAQSKHRRFAPSLIRYRTGGARRTWQNQGDSTEPSNQYAHPRETPYNYSEAVSGGTGAGNTRMAPIVTYSKASDTATITTASRKRAVTPSAPPMEVDKPLKDPLYPPLDQYQV